MSRFSLNPRLSAGDKVLGNGRGTARRVSRSKASVSSSPKMVARCVLATGIGVGMGGRRHDLAKEQQHRRTAKTANDDDLWR